MSGADREIIELRLLGGKAAHGAIAFRGGVPTQPFSVGTQGQWTVVADGVGPLHLFLAFDGQRVHIAAASPDLPVLLAGNNVGRGWVTVPVPCEIRFGVACLAVRSTSEGALATGGESAPSTVSDGGALWQAAQRAVHAAKAAISPAPPVNAGAKAFGSTMMMQQRPGSMAPLTPLPSPVIAAPGTERGKPPSPATEPEPGSDAANADVEPKKKNFWQAASTVKKITLVLMPVALVFSYLMLRDDTRPAPNVLLPAPGGSSVASAARDAGGPTLAAAPPGAPKTAASTAAARAPETAASTEPVAPASRSSPKPAVAGGKPGKRTPEREALDAVAAGSFDDAARQFEWLAATRPDDPSFKDAARILHMKAGHLH